MTDSPYDSEGAARQALSDIVRDFGESGLDNGRLVNVVLPDLLPDSPTEAALLRAAASAGVGGLLKAHLEQGMAIEAAVRDVAAIVIEQHPIAQEAGLWVVTAYANVLGHNISVPPPLSSVPEPAPSQAPAAIRPPTSPTPPQWPLGPARIPPQAPAAATPAPAQSPAGRAPIPPQAPLGAAQISPQAPQVPAVPAAKMDQAYAQNGARPAPQAAVPQDPWQPHGAVGQASPLAAAQYPQFGPFPTPTQGGYAPAYPDVFPAYPQPPKKSNGPWIFAIVVILILAAGGVVAAIELGKKTDNNATPPAPSTGVVHTTPPVTPSATPSPTPTTPPVPSDVDALSNLMPVDLDLSIDCDVSPAQRDGVTGIVAEYDCQEASDSTLADAYVYGYQIDTKSHYQADIAAINKDLNFDPTDRGNATKCPAPTNEKGKTNWYKDNDPSKKLGALECWEATAGGYVYLWTWDDNRSIFIVHGADSQKPSTVGTWWENYS